MVLWRNRPEQEEQEAFSFSGAYTLGTKYSTQTITGYNSSPPPDDGTQVASNLVTWAAQKTKLTDPIKTQVAAIDASLVAALNTSSRAVTSTDAVLATDHLRTLECSGTFTETLLDAATAGAGFQVFIKNVGTGVITVDRATATNTVDNVSSVVTLYTLESSLFVVNAAANGYSRLVGGSTPDTTPIVHGATDRTKRVRIEVDGLTTATDRVVTMADRDVDLKWVAGRNRLKNATFQIDQRINSATSRADDIYGLDCWYTLTQTAAIAVSQQTLVENGFAYGIRLSQSQAAAQRMGFAQIVEARDSQKDRAKAMALGVRIRCSSAQAIRYAILEWTGTADTATSDVVNDWTSSTYTAGNFFLGASLTVTAVGSSTPSANVWTTLPTITGTAGSSLNNWVVLVWTEGTAAQNVTLDCDVAQLEPGSSTSEWEWKSAETDLLESRRYLPAFNSTSTSAPIANGFATSSILAYIVYPFEVDARIAPTGLTVSNAAHFSASQGDATGITCSAVAFQTAGKKCGVIGASVAAGLSTAQGSIMRAIDAAGQLLWTGAEL